MPDNPRKKISKYASLSSIRFISAISGQRTIFPFYHAVGCGPKAHLKHLYKCPTEEQFKQDIEFLLKYFKPVSIEDVLERGGNKRQMLLTFDDGLAECHQFIAPFLKEKGIPAIFFLNNNFIDNRDILYRFKASLLVEYLSVDKCALYKASEYLVVPEEQVNSAIMMISYRQRPLLDSLALELGYDFARYVRDHPIYMSTEQVNDLVKWGFHLGGHSLDHPQFFQMAPGNMVIEISKSMTDLQSRFKGTSPTTFAFPFTSDGVPATVIDRLLDEDVVEVIFGTAGLKNTEREHFIQRIPMEKLGLPAGKTLRTEYLFYLVKMLLGRTRYFKSS